MLNNGEPQTLLPLKDANAYLAVLRLNEEDGWTYKVITIPDNGLSYIAVYDEDGKFVGPL